MPAHPTIGVVILHMGDRPDELAEGLATLRAQRDVELDVVVVGNGWQPQGLPDWVRSVYVPVNAGVPEGRNIGVREARGEYLYFHDDDATLPANDVLSRLCGLLQSHPRRAVAVARGADPDGRPAPRRWVPRIDVRDGGRPGSVTCFSEAFCVIRRSAFEQVGGWPGQFFFGHEGIDLAWRLIDAGWDIEYDPSVTIHHPATDAARHDVYYRTNARNRVWVARRRLPLPLVPVYLGTWTGVMMLRAPDARVRSVWLAGFREGWTTDAGGRAPMSWRTVRLLTRSGRPPVI